MTDLLSLAAWIVLAFSTYRVTRFILFDSLIEEPRTAFHNWLANKDNLLANKLWDLTTCSWCAGAWVALTIYSLYIWSNPTDFNQDDWINVLAVAGGAGLLHAYEPDPED